MQVIRNMAGTKQISNPAIRKLVEQRITDLITMCVLFSVMAPEGST
jgi:hypothetical protein